MAVLNLSFDGFNMNLDAVSESLQRLITKVRAVEEATDFMMNKIDAVNDRFASRNYDRITEALGSCKSKLAKAREEFGELFASCDKLVEKINAIES